MTATVIPFRPRHQPVIESREAILTALAMLRSGHGTQAIDLILSKAADELYDYVETLEGR